MKKGGNKVEKDDLAEYSVLNLVSMYCTYIYTYTCILYIHVNKDSKIEG